MKQARLIILALLALAGIHPIAAETVSPYTVDFNTEISTSSLDFIVAPGWGHIVDADTYYDNHMSYSYVDEGVDGSGALLAYKQKNYDHMEESSGVETYDMLVTPLVSGTVTIYAKPYSAASSSNKALLEFWSLNAEGTARVEKLGSKEWASSGSIGWTAVTITVSTPQHIGIRAQYVYMDNFSATTMTVETVKRLQVAAVKSLSGQTGYNGTNPVFEQQADGRLKVELLVTLNNTGNVDLVAGETENFTLTLARAGNEGGAKTYYADASIAVPQNLPVGQTLEDLKCTFLVPYTQGWCVWYVRENISGTTSTNFRYANTQAYEPKFIFRKAGSSDKQSLQNEQAYGIVSEKTTQAYEIFNGGIAPLTVKSITLPQGFTTKEVPTTPFVLERETMQDLSISLPADVRGDYSGTLQIVYVDKNGADQTYALPFTGKVVAENAWMATFDSKDETPAYPAGSVAEAGITTGYTYSAGVYDHYLKSYTNNSFATENNRFITPKLYADDGESLEFFVARDQQGSNYGLKVYVSDDRKSWGNPVLTLTSDQLTTDFAKKSITFTKGGNYYVAFAIYGVKVDNISGLQTVDVPHDVFITELHQDETTQTGDELTATLKLIPLTSERASGYTVKYYVDGQPVAQAESVDLEASARLTKDFRITFTPNDEKTTDHETYAEVHFLDNGATYRSDLQTLRVIADPYFAFTKPDVIVTKWRNPESVTGTVDFGSVMKGGEQRVFRIYNWGKKPLTLNSLSASQGFSVTVTKNGQPFNIQSQTVPSKDSVTVIIAFAPTVAGTYSGKLTVTHNGIGQESPYELSLTGTLLDNTKWYADFGTENHDYPAGTIFQTNIDVVTPVADDGALCSASESKNLFFSPLLNVKAGDRLTFDARARSSAVTGDKTGNVRVYLVTDRLAAAATDNDDDFLALNPVLATGGNITVDYAEDNGVFQSHIVTMPRAGQYYLAIKVKDAYVDNVYGLTLDASAAHELVLNAVGIPAEAMQNVNSMATLSLFNVGCQDETNYTVTAYIDGEVATEATAAELGAITMSHRLNQAPTVLSVPFHSPRIGTFPVSFRIAVGDYTLQTEPQQVTFTEEIASNEVVVGNATTTSYAVPFYSTWANDPSGADADVLYTSQQLAAFGITAGTKITAITFTPYAMDTKTIEQMTAEAWVGLQDEGAYTPGAPMKNQMQHVYVWNKQMVTFVSGKTVTMRIDLSDAPIVYDGTSGLRLFTNINGNGDYVSLQFDVDEAYRNSLYGRNGSFNSTFNPVATLSVAVEPAVLSGTVKTTSGQPVSGATVTLKSQDGDNIQYQGTTDAQGQYAINVVQSLRSYTVTATAEGFAPDKRVIDMGGESQTLDFSLGSFIPGDVNGNGKVDVTDVTLLISRILGKNPQPFNADAADMDGNGQLNVTDVTLIINVILGK